MHRSRRYSITCDDEDGLVLSNAREQYLWDSFETLIRILAEEGSSVLPPISALMAWKEVPHRKATAKDEYSWRALIELVKNSDLRRVCNGRSAEELVILTDKPTMLKIAGEVTNAYMHSYNLGHRITFGAHKDSKEPS